MNLLLVQLTVLITYWSIIGAINITNIENSNNKYSSSANSSSTCHLHNTYYDESDVVPGEGGPCEQCICHASNIVCSIIKCVEKTSCKMMEKPGQCCPDYKCDCEYNGKIYNNDEVIENPDSPCNVCYCKGGDITCTTINCYHRNDCDGKTIPGTCCPKYDHCPSSSVSTNEPVAKIRTTHFDITTQLDNVTDSARTLLPGEFLTDNGLDEDEEFFTSTIEAGPKNAESASEPGLHKTENLSNDTTSLLNETSSTTTTMIPHQNNNQIMDSVDSVDEKSINIEINATTSIPVKSSTTEKHSQNISNDVIDESRNVDKETNPAENVTIEETTITAESKHNLDNGEIPAVINPTNNTLEIIMNNDDDTKLHELNSTSPVTTSLSSVSLLDDIGNVTGTKSGTPLPSTIPPTKSENSIQTTFFANFHNQTKVTNEFPSILPQLNFTSLLPETPLLKPLSLPNMNFSSKNPWENTNSPFTELYSQTFKIPSSTVQLISALNSINVSATVTDQQNDNTGMVDVNFQLPTPENFSEPMTHFGVHERRKNHVRPGIVNVSDHVTHFGVDESGPNPTSPGIVNVAEPMTHSKVHLRGQSQDQGSTDHMTHFEMYENGQNHTSLGIVNVLEPTTHLEMDEKGQNHTSLGIANVSNPVTHSQVHPRGQSQDQGSTEHMTHFEMDENGQNHTSLGIANVPNPVTHFQVHPRGQSQDQDSTTASSHLETDTNTLGPLHKILLDSRIKPITRPLNFNSTMVPLNWLKGAPSTTQANLVPSDHSNNNFVTNATDIPAAQNRQEPDVESKVHNPLLPYPEEYPEEYQTIQNGPALIITRTTYTRIPEFTYTTVTMATLPTYKQAVKAEEAFNNLFDRKYGERSYTTVRPPYDPAEFTKEAPSDKRAAAGETKTTSYFSIDVKKVPAEHAGKTGGALKKNTAAGVGVKKPYLTAGRGYVEGSKSGNHLELPPPLDDNDLKIVQNFMNSNLRHFN